MMIETESKRNNINTARIGDLCCALENMLEDGKVREELSMGVVEVCRAAKGERHYDSCSVRSVRLFRYRINISYLQGIR
jgi:hypothetical protein